MNLQIDFEGLKELVDRCDAAPEVIGKALRSAVKSGLYHVRQKLVDTKKSNALSWPKLKSFPSQKQIDALLASGSKTKTLGAFLKGQAAIFDNKEKAFFGSLGNALLYNFDPDKLSGEAGGVDTPRVKLSERGKELWRKLQAGYDKPVDDRTRRFFAGIGIPIRQTTTVFHIPQREFFGPVADQQVAAVNSLLFAVVADKISNGFQKTDYLDKMFPA